MKQILLTHSLPKVTVDAIMMLYKNTKVKVRSPDGDTDYFDIVAGVLQGDTWAPYLFIISLNCVLRMSIDKMKDYGFKLANERNIWYPAQTITNANYADDIAFLANTPTQAETLLYGLERAASGIGLYVNADKIVNWVDTRRHKRKRWLENLRILKRGIWGSTLEANSWLFRVW